MPDAVKPGVTDRTAFWLGFRAAAVVAFAVAAAVLLRHQSLKTPLVHGDAWEYWYQTESFRRHGTPELRPEVQKAVGDEASRWGLSSDPQPPYAYAVTPTGRWYGVHFWAYALSVVPAAEYLHLTGGTVLIAPGLANAGWFVLAIGFVLFGSAAPPGQRLALAGLAAVGPVLWYLSWPGAEVFSWALALVSVAAYRDRRYGLAGLAAGLASTQNPPVAFLGAAAVLAAAWERDWRSTVVAFAGSAVSLVPFAFYLHHFGKPNLIAAEFATANSISWARTWGLATDLNQGLFPYAPLLVVGAVAGAVRLAVLGRVRGLLLVGAGLAMVVGVQVAHNWNSDGVGVQRYLVWMIPVAAGVAVEGARRPSRRRVRSGGGRHPCGRPVRHRPDSGDPARLPDAHGDCRVGTDASPATVRGRAGGVRGAAAAQGRLAAHPVGVADRVRDPGWGGEEAASGRGERRADRAAVRGRSRVLVGAAGAGGWRVGVVLRAPAGRRGPGPFTRRCGRTGRYEG